MLIIWQSNERAFLVMVFRGLSHTKDLLSGYCNFGHVPFKIFTLWQLHAFWLTSFSDKAPFLLQRWLFERIKSSHCYELNKLTKRCHHLPLSGCRKNMWFWLIHKQFYNGFLWEIFFSHALENSDWTSKNVTTIIKPMTCTVYNT